MPRYRIRHRVLPGTDIGYMLHKHMVTWTQFMSWNPNKKPPNDRLYIGEALNMSGRSADVKPIPRFESMAILADYDGPDETNQPVMQRRLEKIGCPQCVLEEIPE